MCFGLRIGNTVENQTKPKTPEYLYFSLPYWPVLNGSYRNSFSRGKVMDPESGAQWQSDSMLLWIMTMTHMSLYPVLIPLSLVGFFSLILDKRLRLSRDHSVTFWKGVDFFFPCAQMLTDIYMSPSQIGQMQPFERWAVCTWMTTEMPALTIDAPHALHNTCCPRETSLSETSSPMLANHPVEIHLGKNSLLWEGATSTRPWKLVCMLVWLLVWPQDSIGPKTAF